MSTQRRLCHSRNLRSKGPCLPQHLTYPFPLLIPNNLRPEDKSSPWAHALTAKSVA